jgi:hypothetical protein
MDIVILRPQRDPRVTAASTVAEKEEAWKDRAREVLGAAYNDGAHVNLTYGKEGRGTQVQGEGEVVVETFRCGGFEWTPTVSCQDMR